MVLFLEATCFHWLGNNKKRFFSRIKIEMFFREREKYADEQIVAGLLNLPQTRRKRKGRAITQTIREQ